VTADELADPQSLELATLVNGRVMQQSNTSDMIFPAAHLIAELSRDMTLMAGTVILTGTPSGVGVARDPQVFLKPGDQVVCTIDRIGELVNPVVAGT
jgi:2-keto-4-pentenoate hydratase/2-oxohepta-3-ene-1,7-dioic acid hydratase in catechol pathway